tara:strand:+ start:1008 stop:1955 length:948 start_codon:yes stop_codon:yes gene_type:complete
MSRASDLRNITATGTASEDNYVLTYDDATKKLSLEAAAGGDLVDDTTPQLGGDLSTNGHSIIINQSGLITGEVLRFNNSSGTFGTVLYRNSALSDFYMNNYVGHLRINNEDTNKNIIITTDGLVDINANNGDVDITAVGGTVKLAGDTGDMTFTNTYNGVFNFKDTANNSDNGPILELFRDPPSGTMDGYNIGTIDFVATNTQNTTPHVYARMYVEADDGTWATEDGSIRFRIGSSGTEAKNRADTMLLRHEKVEVFGTIQGSSNAEITTSPIRKHSNTISTDTTIASSENAVSGGPITIASGVTVTVSGDWTVV